MIRRTAILSLCLGAVALGPSAFGAESPEDMREQADGLRNLLEAAGRTGLVELRSDGDAPDSSESVPASDIPAADCIKLAPLFDGGQDGFATGQFTELTRDWPETTALARSVDQLLDPSYRDEPLDVDLRRAADCGDSFLPWQVLTQPGQPLDATTEAKLTTALSQMEPSLRRLVGMQIAIRAGLSGNLRLSRRVADTLTDAGLHGRYHHQRDMDHVLLDAILKMRRDPVGTRARLAWIAERDGPEQFHAIDLLRKLDANAAARQELGRLSQSPDDAQRVGAQARLIATAIEDADIELVAEMVTTTDMLDKDADSLARLDARLIEAIENGNALQAVQSLDVIARLKKKGVAFGPELLALADKRMKAFADAPAANTSSAYTSDLAETSAPKSLSGDALEHYLDTLSSDQTTFTEVLSRG